MKATAQIINIACGCGGDFYDDETSSYDIRSDTRAATCDRCGKKVTDKHFPKTARLFA